MTFSRMHLGMLGVVSIFTGIISPVVRTSISGFPLPLTDLQIPAYFVLLALAIICILLAVRSWFWVRIFAVLVLLLLGYLFVIALTGEVRTNTGILAPSLSWGWVFLIIGSGLLTISMFGEHIQGDTPTLSDHLLGWLASIAVLALTGLIISISYIPITERANRNRVIESLLGTGSTETHSGIIMSIPFSSIEKLVFDRKQDALSFFTASGTAVVSIPRHQAYNQLPYATTMIGDVHYTITAEGFVTTDTGSILGKAILPQSVDRSILMYSGSELLSLSEDGIHTMSGKYTNIQDIIATKDGNHTIWRSRTASGYTLYIDGKAVGKEERMITQIGASSNGRSVMVLIREGDGKQYILKNGIKIAPIESGYIKGTLRMNGTDSIYAIEGTGGIELIHNGILMDRKFDEIREIFLDTDGSGYMYFGRPLGERSYCLYTRYRGNLCGLTGYMNPHQAPDSSIIYAGLKDGAWGIYRNTAAVIRNTGYPNQEDISRDYVFFDITNPTYYLFIRGDTDGYSLYKKGAWVPGTWKDVGLDITFGYDSKVIMSAKDDKGWRVIEL